MADLELLHEATVGETEIDELGHMNVRFYHVKALGATRVLASRHGLSPEACDEMGARFELRDNYTRHYAEQMVGARLVVRGGIIDVRPWGLRFYHELVNEAREEVAATFVHDLELRDSDTQTLRPLPEMVANLAGRSRTEWPVRGQPRTLDLEAAPPELDLSFAQERGLAMRTERKVLAEECDADGYFVASRYQDLVWGGEPIDRRRRDSWLLDTKDGGKFGWATLESRGILLELPRVGARIQSFGAEVDLAAKTSLRHHWVFDLDRRVLVCASSVVNLAFDIAARRAIEIPAAIRESLSAQYHPDLR